MRKVKLEPEFFTSPMKSPVGVLRLYATKKALIAVYMEKSKRSPLKRVLKNALVQETKLLTKTKQQLADYFAGKRKKFTIPTELRGTEFQKSVWHSLMEIKSGELRSYGEHAASISKLKAVRAVGSAIGSNPISIIIPCHRVVGSDGSLAGYAGGLKAKELLLKLEGHDTFLSK